jgi:tetratricopeptide (TPR) repeat protein
MDSPIISPDHHRALAIEANNATWAQLTSVREGTAGDRGVTGLVRGAYAAAYHWERATGYGPANEARARYLIGQAWLASGRAEVALDYGDRTMAVCRDAGLVDFDLAYAHELRARALGALGRHTESEEAWRAAKAVPIADPEDRAIVDADFADAPV